MVSDVLGDARGRGKKWVEAWKEPDKAKRHAIIREILKDYKAIVDFPASVMVKDPLEIYPDAKVR